MCEQENHEEEDLLYYCDECNECICYICHEDSHWRHDVGDIQQAAREGKRRLDEILKKAEDEITASEGEIKKSEDIFNIIRQEIGEARRNVEATVNELIKNLKQHEKAVMTKIDRISEKQQSCHAIKKRKLELLVTRLKHAVILCSKEGNFLDYFWYVRKPCSVSVKSNGDLIVCDSADAEVKILSHDGCHILDSFAGDPVLDGAPSFAIHYQDRFFVSFPKTRCVKVFSEDGDFFYDIGTSREVKEQLIRPLGLAIDKLNRLIVFDSDGCALQVFTLNGRHVTSIEGRDNGFQSPQFIAVSNDGRLFFTDTGKKCVHVFH